MLSLKKKNRDFEPTSSSIMSQQYVPPAGGRVDQLLDQFRGQLSLVTHQELVKGEPDGIILTLAGAGQSN